MLSTMQDTQLGVRRLLEHGARVHRDATIVTVRSAPPATPEVDVEVATFAEIGSNAARLAHALAALGVGRGDRVATFMWNNRAHLEAYYAAPCMGAVVHPLNIRLPGDQVTFIANHAEDKVLLVDASLLPLMAPLLPALKTVEHLVVVGGDPADPGGGALAEAVPGDGALPVHDYDTLLAAAEPEYPWPDLDERTAAAMCYTSGTTGNPKGVVYSHRSIALHTLNMCLPDAFCLSARDSVLLIVPQFHVLAWGTPYAAFLTGAGLVMPGPFLQPEPLAAAIAALRPTKASGVPTVWQGLLNYVREHPEADISSLREGVIGGSACPPALLDAYDELGITLLHAWGMTEMSPMGTVARPPAGTDPASPEARRARLTQGRVMPLIEARLVGPSDEVLPHDGVQAGELEVRGPSITGAYFRDDDPAKFHDGWLRTGDVGVIDPGGYLTLTDRVKDVIKSGGEWISSVDLENQLMCHPAVAEAAVIAVPDDRWGERPLAAVVVRPGAEVTVGELREFLAARVAKWQVPERWAFVAEVPKTSVGKFDKKVLRARHAAGDLPAATGGA